MSKLIMTRGLPASGKSTWAKEQIAKSDGKIKRVNKDDLRAMIDDGKWSNGREKNILATRDAMVGAWLGAGFDVIVDDTNFATKHIERLKQIAGKDVDVRIMDFDCPPSVCEERDAKRANPVGAKVIRDMWRRYVCQPRPERNPELPDAIIVDIDGTLADISHRNPYDATKYLDDALHTDVYQAVIQMYLTLNNGKIIICSGRSDEYRDITTEWLKKYKILHHDLLMRPAGDTRPDHLIKGEIYERDIKGKYNVLCVFDDRQQVVDMWRENGLRVFQVADGVF